MPSSMKLRQCFGVARHDKPVPVVGRYRVLVRVRARRRASTPLLKGLYSCCRASPGALSRRDTRCFIRFARAGGFLHVVTACVAACRPSALRRSLSSRNAVVRLCLAGADILPRGSRSVLTCLLGSTNSVPNCAGLSRITYVQRVANPLGVWMISCQRQNVRREGNVFRCGGHVTILLGVHDPD